MITRSKSKIGGDFTLYDFPDFENSKKIVNENHKKCINSNDNLNNELYYKWRKHFKDMGYSDMDLTKLIQEKKLQNELTYEEKKIPFFCINKNLDIHVLRILYEEKNK